ASGSWARAPTLRAGGERSTVPEVGSSRPARHRSRVVLPAPLRPSTPIRVVPSTTRSTLSSTTWAPRTTVRFTAASMPQPGTPPAGRAASIGAGAVDSLRPVSGPGLPSRKGPQLRLVRFRRAPVSGRAGAAGQGGLAAATAGPADLGLVGWGV